MEVRASRKIITYGTFDLFHFGHLKILERAKALGTHLTVGVSTDDFNQLKGKQCYYPFEHRAKIVAAIRFVDVVIPEFSWEQKKADIFENNIDVFVLGNDWEGKFDELKQYCEVVYLERTSGISTSIIKEGIPAK